ncbi:MAG: ribonuclease HI [Desulfobacterales bacterium]|nr:ribonuclease HI [Desulfobacterales bacterium]
MSQKKFYAVANGREKGIFTTWFGNGGAFEQVDGFPRAVFKGFLTREEAEQWLAEKQHLTTCRPAASQVPVREPRTVSQRENSTDAMILYTDGGSLGNPGPGGYGVVQLYKGRRKEFSGGYRLTTNNRMELMGCIVALRESAHDGPIILHSDSKYVVDGITRGWARRWRAKGWMRTPTEKAKNADLWAQLLALTEKRDVVFKWVKGHAGIAENERCDFLVNREQARKDLPADIMYEKECGVHQ